MLRISIRSCHLEEVAPTRDLAFKERFLAPLEMTKLSPKKNSEAGLTLLELMISLVMVAALTTTLWLVYNTSFFAFYNQSKRTDIKGEAGRALSSMSWELRQAASVTTATATNLIFTFDTDGNGTDD